jgi:hypothetical protein
VETIDPSDQDGAIEQRGLVYLAAQKAGDPKLADEQWQLLLATMAKADHHTRRLGEMLSGNRPLETDLVRRLPIDPEQKRVLLAVIAQRHPETANDLLPLARALDFQRDGTSLCLRKLLE